MTELHFTKHVPYLADTSVIWSSNPNILSFCRIVCEIPTLRRSHGCRHTTTGASSMCSFHGNCGMAALWSRRSNLDPAPRSSASPSGKCASGEHALNVGVCHSARPTTQCCPSPSSQDSGCGHLFESFDAFSAGVHVWYLKRGWP